MPAGCGAVVVGGEAEGGGGGVGGFAAAVGGVEKGAGRLPRSRVSLVAPGYDDVTFERGRRQLLPGFVSDGLGQGIEPRPAFGLALAPRCGRVGPCGIIFAGHFCASIP